MIVNGKMSRVLGWGGLLTLLGLGVVLLPLVPRWATAQAPPPVDRPPASVPKDSKPNLDRAKDEIAELEKRLSQLRAELRETEDKLAAAKKHLGDTQNSKPEERVILKLQGADGKIQTIELPPGVRLIYGPVPAGPNTGPPLPNPRQYGEPTREPLPGKGPAFTPLPPGAGKTDGGNLERRLDDLTRELEELQRELRRQPTPSRPGKDTPPR